MVDYVCLCVLDLRGARTENYKMNNICQQWDLNPKPFTSEANQPRDALLVAISIEHLFVDCVLYKFVI